MVKGLRGLTFKERRLLLWMSLLVYIGAFLYVHWISYRIAVRHIEPAFDFPILPVALGILFLISMFKERKNKGRAFLVCVFFILFVGSILMQFEDASCPGCTEIKDPVYLYLCKVFTGHEYGFP